jgi:hypothetical protein
LLSAALEDNLNITGPSDKKNNSDIGMMFAATAAEQDEKKDEQK